MKNKILSFLLSVAIAFGLWLYVINVENPGSEEYYYDIPVVWAGETVLNERDFLITAGDGATVDLKLTGNRSDLNALKSSDITVTADISNIGAGKHRLQYIVSFPRSFASNTFAVEDLGLGYVTVTVEKKIIKDVPVVIQWVGERSEDHLYDTDNRVLDYSAIEITGPSSVADLITQAVIQVDLTDRIESFAESYRYTLCDAEGNPVDAQMITVENTEVRMELKIQRIKEVELYMDVTYGAGANENNTSVAINPQVIRVSGSDAALESLGDRIKLGSIDLSTMEEPVTTLYPITLPDNVTNETGVTEAEVSVTFPGLTTKEFVVERIRGLSAPEGMETEIITEKLTVTVRGTSALVNKLTASDITINVDLSGAVAGTGTYKGTVVFAEGYEDVGVMGTCSVTVTVKEPEE